MSPARIRLVLVALLLPAGAYAAPPRKGNQPRLRRVMSKAGSPDRIWRRETYVDDQGHEEITEITFVRTGRR